MASLLKWNHEVFVLCQSRAASVFFPVRKYHSYALAVKSCSRTIEFKAEPCNFRRFCEQKWLSVMPNKVSSIYHYQHRRYSTATTTTVTSPVIYRGSLTKAVHVTKFISLTSSLFGLSVQPYLISHAATAHPAMIVAVGSFVCFFTYGTPFAIHWLTKRYVTELQFNPESGIFTSTTLTFFLRPKHMEFQASDVTVPEIPGPFTSFFAKGLPLFVDSRQFEDADAYRHLMGYDKPLDLKLGKLEDKMS